MSAYRSNHDALLAQCDALRGELAEAKEGSAELARIQSELKAKLADLAASRISDAEIGLASQRLTLRGAFLGLAFSTIIVAGVVAHLSTRSDAPVARKAVDTTPAEWFASARAHCNPVEASVYLRDKTPPGGDAGTPYLAACFALAGKLDDARATINSLPASQRYAAANIVFDVVHPIADAGDDMAAGPVMELVLEYTPNNYMALYHAGMSAHGKGDKAHAKRRLYEFLQLYSEDNHFTRTAIATLKELETPAQD